jgi:hypothetical protein
MVERRYVKIVYGWPIRPLLDKGNDTVQSTMHMVDKTCLNPQLLQTFTTYLHLGCAHSLESDT